MSKQIPSFVPRPSPAVCLIIRTAVRKFLAAGVCEPLIPDIMVSEAHSTISGPTCTFESLRKNLA